MFKICEKIGFFMELTLRMVDADENIKAGDVDKILKCGSERDILYLVSQDICEAGDTLRQIVESTTSVVGEYPKEIRVEYGD